MSNAIQEIVEAVEQSRLSGTSVEVFIDLTVNELDELFPANLGTDWEFEADADSCTVDVMGWDTDVPQGNPDWQLVVWCQGC
jgi:hypothetical protein